MEIILNGKKTILPPDIKTFKDLLVNRYKEHRGLVVEANGKLILKSSFEIEKLKTGDKIEIVQFMGGG